MISKVPLLHMSIYRGQNLTGPHTVMPPPPASPARMQIRPVGRYGHANSRVHTSFRSSVARAKRLALSIFEHFSQVSSKRLRFKPPNEHQMTDFRTYIYIYITKSCIWCSAVNCRHLCSARNSPTEHAARSPPASLALLRLHKAWLKA